MRLMIALALQMAALVSFLIWVFTAMFAPMLFAGSDGANTRVVFGLFITMPVLMIIASGVIWFGHVRNQAQTMVMAAAIIALSFVPLLWN